MTLRLNALGKGQKARISRIQGAGAVRKRLADMGLSAGALIEMERVAPLGDPVEFVVRGYHLSLRKQEAEGIEVEIV